MPLTDEAEQGSRGQSDRSGWIGFAAAPICSNNIKGLSGYREAVTAKSSRIHHRCTRVSLDHFTVTDEKHDTWHQIKLFYFFYSTNPENGFLKI